MKPDTSSSAAAISGMPVPRGLQNVYDLQNRISMPELGDKERETLVKAAYKNLGGRRRLTKRSKKSKRVTRVKRRRSSMRYF